MQKISTVSEVPKTTCSLAVCREDSQDTVYICTHSYNLLQQNDAKQNQQREKGT